MHSHHGVDDTERGIRVTRISVAALLVTALIQAAVVVLTGSAGLLADTLHNFGDAFASIPLWIAFNLTRREANRRFTYGYARSEDLAGLLIVLFILVSAAVAAYESIGKLVTGEPPRFVGVAMVAALIGAAGNEAVAHYRIRAGKEIGSQALVADGQHARTDGLTSLAAFLGLVGVALGFPLADPIAGLLITAFILFILVEVGRSLLVRVMDAVEPGTIEQLERAAMSVPRVQAVHQLRARWHGHRLLAELHLSLPEEMSLAEAHQVAEEVRHRLLHDVPRLGDAIVHLDPLDGGDVDHHALTAHHFEPEGEDGHDGHHDHDQADHPHHH